MAIIFKNLARQVALAGFRRPHLTSLCSPSAAKYRTPMIPRMYSVFEPSDIGLEPEVKEYECLQIQIKGYDFVILESFEKYIAQIVSQLDLDYESFPSPGRSSHVTVLQPQSSLVHTEYDLSLYERVVQLDDVPAPKLSILLETLQQQLPSGVKLVVKEPVPEEEEWRYIPDLELRELHSQLDDMDRAREERRKK